MDRLIRREVEAGLEYVLPDYMGAVKRVLYSKARFIPAGRLISDESVEVTGIVGYEIAYVDNEGRLTLINTTSDVEIRENLSDAAVSGAEVSAGVKNLAVRVVGPRKLSLRAGVSVLMTVAEDSDL